MKKYKIFNIPFLGYKTHAMVYGDIRKNIPIILLHGGPGGISEKYEALTQLVDKDIPIILYDQFGSGYSKIPPDQFKLYTFKTFVDELENLLRYFNINQYILLGHSWGGMLTLHFFLNCPHKGLEKLILFSTLPSTKMWNEEHLAMINNFPIKEKTALLNELNNKPYDKVDFKNAVKLFNNTYVGKKSERVYINKRKRFPKSNRQIYNYMWGSSEFVGQGTLKDYNVEDELININIPTLILSGKYDESTPNINKFMHERIKNSKWVLLEHSHHAGYVEEPDKVIDAISKFYFDNL